ncbi:MAG: 1-(5-phosphoribosyl)-5-[(5-phosphoribosylamino)methylideneamino]imidazole-4-carboxamide isomerase [Acidimicrobiales bacterium]|nr:1-(5-phosphoribosyl)-5-[(5-phosphoribosylamino)methylideneamino]imidazole-4-carboxamide isomerase [Acidimicrobiales bacterium]
MSAPASMELLPAIDLRDGRCVRLYQGDYDRETVYGDDPVAQARRFADAGSPWVHVVDLDAARSGEPVNRPVVAAIAGAVGAKVQTGGGVRDEAAAEALVAAGVTRVVLGTAALEDPVLVRRLAARLPVAVGLDVRGREVAVRGWEQGSGRDLLDVLGTYEDAGVEAVVVTQIARDGTLDGPDVDGLAEVLGATTMQVVASGGVGTLDDLRTLAGLVVDGRRLAGAIVGRALYEGRFTIDEALAAVAESG